METKSLAQIEADKMEKKEKMKKKIKIFIIIFLTVYICIMPTPLFDLAVVSIRWGRPMIYKEHIQSGAIWDLRKRTHTAFTAYPLFGDPEEDEFYIERDNRLIVFPWDIEDGYYWVTKREIIEKEALRIAHEEGFEDVKVKLFIWTDIACYGNLNMFSSLNDAFEKDGDSVSIVYSAHYSDDLNEEIIFERFNTMLEKLDELGYGRTDINFNLYYNKDTYDKIGKESRVGGNCLRVYREQNETEVCIFEIDYYANGM